MKNLNLILALVLTIVLLSCTKENTPEDNKINAPVEFYATFGPMTRVGELPASQISNDNKGLMNVGLYMYYPSDYNAGNLSKPYIRNLECKVVGNRLMPLDEKPIYLYDQMVVVAFYPYNASVINFNVKADEEAYPITRSEYSQQVYIPYRAQATIDPTVAYKVNLGFSPKHTSKIEVVIVGGTSAPATLSNPMVVPKIDPTDAPVDMDSREQMFDQVHSYTNSGGGKSVTQFVAYVWNSEQGAITHDNNSHVDNIINIGDPIFQSDELTLLATETVNLAENRIYRYGYNLTTGEVFIPTSSNLIYDAASLSGSPSGFQVCDIDLSHIANWTPINMSGGVFDGGGHKITGLTITSAPADGNVGLFGRLQGSATVKNVAIESPRITINAGTTPVNIGALCGMNNKTLTLTPSDIASMRQALVNSLPPGVASVVIDALLQDQILKLQGGSSSIVACKVSNAIITLSGKSLKAGLLCGKNGDASASATIADSYATGVINANVGVGILNDTCYVAGLAGVNNATITRCYVVGTITAEKYLAGTPNTLYNGGAGFCFQGPNYTGNSGSVSSCYATQANTQPVVPLMPGSWPAWSTYTGKWPIFSGAIAQWHSMGSSATPTYPTLVWER